MIKRITPLLIAALLVSSCGSTADRQMAGTYNGAMLGGMLGSAIGGVVGSHRSAALGNIIGIAAGGVLGHVTSAPKGKKRHAIHPSIVADVRAAVEASPMGTFPDADTIQAPAQTPDSLTAEKEAASIEIEDLTIYEAVTDGVLAPNEQAEIEFILHNTTAELLTNVVPVLHATPDKHILISPSVPVTIKAGGKVRYTAFVRVRSGIRPKPIQFSVRVDHAGRVTDEKLFTLQGRKSATAVPAAKREYQP